jgi:hypothetical protein
MARQAAFSALIPPELNRLGHEPVSRSAEKHLPVRQLRMGVDNHRHLNLLQVTLADELLLSSEIADFPLVAQTQPLFDFDKFLGRGAQEKNLSAYLFAGAGRGQTEGGAQHDGNLEVMTAKMRRAGDRIGPRVVAIHDRIHLPHDQEPRPGPGPGQNAFHPCYGDSFPDGQIKTSQRGGNQFRGFRLLESEFRMPVDFLCPTDDFFPIFIYETTGRLLYYILVHKNLRT